MELTCPGCGREFGAKRSRVKHTNRCPWLITFPEFAALGEVDTSDPESCWIWRPRTNKHYGDFTGDRAHRQAFRIAYGEEPGKLDVCHDCDNPPCVNPLHLFLGTRSDNIRDAVQKGRVVSPMSDPAIRAKMGESQRVRYARMRDEE